MNGAHSVKTYYNAQVIHPVLPQWVILIDRREQPKGSQDDLQWVLLAKSGERLHCCCLPRVNEAVSDNLSHDSWPPRVEWVLWDGHRDTAAAHTYLNKAIPLI